MSGRGPLQGNRPSTSAFRWLVLATASLAFALVVLGGVVRITGSGLGCPDWPLCHGRLIPPFNWHTLLEYSHRLVAGVVSTLVGVIFVIAWLQWRSRKAVLVLATLALGLLASLVALGGIVVLAELPSALVSLHLVLSEALLATLAVLYVVLRAPKYGAQALPGKTTVGPVLLWLTGAAVLGIAGLVVSGAFVRGAGATYACISWPFCGDQLLPVWGLPGLHMAHRLVTLAVSTLVVAALVAVWRHKKALPGAEPSALAIAGLFVLQIAMGAVMIFTRFNPVVRALHLALATGVWVGVVSLAAISWCTYLSSLTLSGSSQSQGRQTADRSRSKQGAIQTFLTYLELTKPTLVVLLLLTSVGGAFLAASGPPQIQVVLALLVGGALTAGGANALNHALDEDIDGAMTRTRKRPLPSHRVSPANVVAFGALLTSVGFFVLLLGANPLSAVLALLASGLYVSMYTGWLKRKTAQNIVIGGVAGALPPVVGWVAVTGSLALPTLFLFLIVFLWTPPHFWSLALAIRDDYARAGVPMLPVVKGEMATRRAIAAYTLAVAVVSIAFYFVGSLGLLYLATATVMGTGFLWQAVRLLRRSDRRVAMNTFAYSLVYLALLFVAMIVDASGGL